MMRGSREPRADEQDLQWAATSIGRIVAHHPNRSSTRQPLFPLELVSRATPRFVTGRLQSSPAFARGRDQRRAKARVRSRPPA